MVPAQPRLVRGPFLFSADHCFLVKGQGTVLTGTVLSGSAEVRCYLLIFYVCCFPLTMVEYQARGCCIGAGGRLGHHRSHALASTPVTT